jgi:hypothetical protein
MDRIAQQALQRRENAIAEVRTVAGAERRKQAVREKILTMMGGLPDYKGPLNPRVTGRLRSESFTIETVITRVYRDSSSPPIFTCQTIRVAIPVSFCSPAIYRRGSRSRKGSQRASP